MSVKSEVIAMLNAKKEEKLVAIAAEFDSEIAFVQGLPEDVPPDLVELQQALDAANAQIVVLQGQLSAIQAAFEADEIEDNAALLSKDEQIAAMQVKLDAIRTVLDS